MMYVKEFLQTQSLSLGDLYGEKNFAHVKNFSL